MVEVNKTYYYKSPSMRGYIVYKVISTDRRNTQYRGQVIFTSNTSYWNGETFVFERTSAIDRGSKELTDELKAELL